MVFITEILTVTGLVLKVNNFIFNIPNNWYTGSSEIKTFKSDLSILSQRASQWEKQLKHHGMTEDSVLMSFLAKASEVVDEEEQHFQAHRKNLFWKFKRRLFPGKLTSILTEVRKIVEAGPQLLKEAVETADLLTKNFRMETSELPFGNDPKYVPLQQAVEEVEKALEDEEGPQVVTLYGEPGMGKSALAKHIALRYQGSTRGSSASSFDKVQYLFFGQGCRNNIGQMQRDFLSSLGLGSILGGSGEGQNVVDSYSLSSYQSTLRRVLKGKRRLIILDDVWEEDFEVLVSFIGQGTECRYLLTSQTRNVWPDAQRIHMPKPTEEEALEIFLKHVQGRAS